VVAVVDRENLPSSALGVISGRNFQRKTFDEGCRYRLGHGDFGVTRRWLYIFKDLFSRNILRFLHAEIVVIFLRIHALYHAFS